MHGKEVRQRLIFVTEYYTPSNNAPGARFGPLVQSLKKYFSVIVFTSKVSKVLERRSVRCNWIGFPGNTRSLMLRLLFEILYSMETFCRLCFSRGEIYYITSPSYFNCLFSFFYCRLFSRRYVVDIRDDYPRVFFDNGLIKEKSVVGRFLVWIEKQIYRHAYVVIAATEGLCNCIKEKYDGEVILLRNGFSEERFWHTTQKYNRFTLVFHGNLGYYQDIDLIKKIAETVHQKNLDIDILIIGKGSEDYKLTREALPDNLTYIGAKPYDEIPKIIQKAHVGLSFRKPGKISEDSFPVRTYEYIGVGLPIIVTPLSEAGNFITSNGIGFQFESTDEANIVNEIIRLRVDGSLYQSMVDNIMQKRNSFSRERMSDQLALSISQRIHESDRKHS